ncbi:Uma2 family endonuclease [Actinoplanes oblitus]|uniref:Uma2 family endonuclease n=1 Tax=Actinoplanes oblitus TaxID=3040509 RepID=A0ABY8WCC5_9ACTN|nr:Uma2 family endonuclease [Actinoplanes oblitus]WIM94756.1 Uma2 family endonuclease [Actinoplanes oblitus]
MLVLNDPVLHLSALEDLDVEDLVHLPPGYRYELHNGNLVIMTPSSFWHKDMTMRVCLMLLAAGARAFQDPGVLGTRPRDCRLPDVGVVLTLPPNTADYSNLPGSAFSLVVEVVSENSPNGEYTYKADWYAEQGIPEYWIVERDDDRSHDDATVIVNRLGEDAGKPVYIEKRKLRLSELEAEYKAGRAEG